MRIHTYHSHAHKQIVGSLAFSVQGEDATRWIQRVNKAIGNEGNSRSAQAVRKACEVAGEGYLPAQAQPLLRGQGVQRVGGGAVAAWASWAVKETVQVDAHLRTAKRLVDEHLQARGGIGDRVGVAYAPVLVLVSNKRFWILSTRLLLCKIQ